VTFSNSNIVIHNFSRTKGNNHHINSSYYGRKNFLLIKLSGKSLKGVKLEEIAYNSELKENMTIEESM